MNVKGLMLDVDIGCGQTEADHRSDFQLVTPKTTSAIQSVQFDRAYCVQSPRLESTQYDACIEIRCPVRV